MVRYSNGGLKTGLKKVWLWSKISSIWMVHSRLYHFNTGHPYCPVFRWICYSGVWYSDGYCTSIWTQTQYLRLKLLKIKFLIFFRGRRQGPGHTFKSFILLTRTAKVKTHFCHLSVNPSTSSVVQMFRWSDHFIYPLRSRANQSVPFRLFR